MRRARTLAAVAVLATALLAGCGGSGSTDGDEEPELVVFAAASLGPAFERYGEAFEGADVRYSFAGSDELAAQIRQGVEPDVYVAANTSLPEELHAEGLLERPSTFATNELVVGVPAGSAIDDVGDLRRSGVEVAIGDEDVPVGIYTREVLDALGAGAGEAILANVASSEPDVTGIVAKLTQGAVDAGFVYRSDVDAAAGAIEAVPLPERASPAVAYGIAVTTAAAEPEAAQRFVDGIIAGSGRNILADSGFGLPPR